VERSRAKLHVVTKRTTYYLVSMGMTLRLWGMPWCREDLVRTDVSEERVASIFRAKKYPSENSVRRLLTD
jgi:hypothetical protein